MATTKQRLDDVVIGKLPKHVTKALGKMKLEVEEMQDWVDSRPRFLVRYQDNYLDIDLKLHIPGAKILVVVSIIVGVIWVLFQIYSQFGQYIKLDF